MEYDTMSKLQFHVMPATCKQEQSRGKWGDDIPQVGGIILEFNVLLS